MAGRRGPNNAERLALDMANITSSGTLLSAPAFVYKIVVTCLDTEGSALCTLGDATATAAVIAESDKMTVKVGGSGASALQAPLVLDLNPPLFVQNKLYCTTTGVSVSVFYLDAQ